MRVVPMLSALCLAACASQPTNLTPQPGQTAADVELEKQHLAEAIKYGYKVVNKDGETLYCRSDWATGSHIQKSTVCLTAQQLDDLNQRNDRDYSIPNRSPVSAVPH